MSQVFASSSISDLGWLIMVVAGLSHDSLNASSTFSLSCDNQKYLQSLSNIPCRGREGGITSVEKLYNKVWRNVLPDTTPSFLRHQTTLVQSGDQGRWIICPRSSWASAQGAPGRQVLGEAVLTRNNLTFPGNTSVLGLSCASLNVLSWVGQMVHISLFEIEKNEDDHHPPLLEFFKCF